MPARLAILSLLVLLQSAAVAYAEGPYYLALGDSLAIGVQPTPRGDRPTTQGYADHLYGFYRLRTPGLRLAKLGCSGETTSSMIVGGVCSYPLGSQLLQAINFLQTHDVLFVTIDIGADNLDRCISASGANLTCVNAGISAALVDLPQILAALSAVAPNVPIFAMNYYDPFLAAWRVNPTVAVETLALTRVFNTALENVYQTFGVPVADVATAYHISDFDEVPVLRLPLNVVLALRWTWTASPSPLGPDIHPNLIGYGVIAGAFVKVIGTH